MVSIFDSKFKGQKYLRFSYTHGPVESHRWMVYRAVFPDRPGDTRDMGPRGVGLSIPLQISDPIKYTPSNIPIISPIVLNGLGAPQSRHSIC